jgi:diaminopimelate decarboxylase
MSVFEYRDDKLFVEQVSLAEIAEKHGTPTYVYSRAAIVAAYREFADAVSADEQKVTICYAMKANSTLGILDCLAREGAGFDIVSGGELKRVLAAGGKANTIVFSGVGKSVVEITDALNAGVRCFNVESEPELERLSQLADSLNVTASVSVRVNPNVDAGTHPYISTGLRENKFGIAHERATAVYKHAVSLPGIKVSGIDCHIGSQITELAPFLAALDKLIELINELSLSGIELDHIDLGGGLGVSYQDETPPARGDLIRAIVDQLHARMGDKASQYELFFEFGRSMVASAGALLTRVEYLKPTDAKNFAIMDAAMNDLLRPSLYQAAHRVLPALARQGQPLQWDLVGPICESGDWLAKDCALDLKADDVLAIADAGAYGMVMASNYNTRARATEVIVDGDQIHVVRERESFEQIISGERVLPS